MGRTFFKTQRGVSPARTHLQKILSVFAQVVLFGDTSGSCGATKLAGATKLTGAASLLERVLRFVYFADG